MKREFYDMLNRPDEEFIEMSLSEVKFCLAPLSLEMGLAAGGSMHQEIYEDPHKFDAWDLRQTERCFVTLANAEQWMNITGEEPPMSAISAKSYTEAGLPWFDYYGEDKIAIEGAKKLGNIKSIKQLEVNTKSGIWPADSVIKNPTVVHLERRQINIGEW